MKSDKDVTKNKKDDVFFLRHSVDRYMHVYFIVIVHWNRV